MVIFFYEYLGSLAFAILCFENDHQTTVGAHEYQEQCDSLIQQMSVGVCPLFRNFLGIFKLLHSNWPAFHRGR